METNSTTGDSEDTEKLVREVVKQYTLILSSDMVKYLPLYNAVGNTGGHCSNKPPLPLPELG